MKSTLKKSMAMILVVLMALSCCAISSFAAVEDSDFVVANFGTVSGITGKTNDVLYYGGYLYVTSPEKGLEVWDVTNRTAPVKTSFVDPAYNAETPNAVIGEQDGKETMLLIGTNLYVAYNNQTAKKYSLANPAQPTLQAVLTNSATGYIWDLAKHGNNLMATRNDGSSIQWVNAITATATDGVPAEIAATNHSAVGSQYRIIPSTSTDVYYYYDSVRIGFRDRGEKGLTGVRSAGISPAGYLYILIDDALYALKEEASNIGTRIDAATPIAIEGVDESKFTIEPEFYNNYMVFMSTEGEYLIFDISNPTAPVRVTGFENIARQGMRNLAITPDGYIYALSMWMEPGVAYHTTLNIDKIVENSVSINRAELSFTATAASNIAIGESVKNVVSVGDYLFFNGQSKGLVSYNTKTGAKTNNYSEHYGEPNGAAPNMFLDGNKLFLAMSPSGSKAWIEVFNVSRPEAPTKIGKIGAMNGDGTFANGYGAGRGFLKPNADYLVYFCNYGARYMTPAEVTGSASWGTGGFTGGQGYIWMQSYSAAEGHSFYVNHEKKAYSYQRDAQGGDEKLIDATTSYSVFENGGYVYIIQDDAIKVAPIAAIEADNGYVSSDLFAANASSFAITGIDESKIQTAPVVYDNYLIYPADKLLVFDISNPAAPVQTNIGSGITFTSINRGAAINNGVMYVTDGTSTVRAINLGYQINEVVSTEITALPVVFAGNAEGVSTVTLTVGSDSYTVPVVDGFWSKEITEVSDANGEIEVTVTAGYSSASADYTLNLPVPELAVNVSYADAFNATVTIENNNENKEFMAILVVYNGDEIYDVDYEVISATDTLSCVAPGGDVSGYTAKTFVWSDLMVPFLTVPVAR